MDPVTERAFFDELEKIAAKEKEAIDLASLGMTVGGAFGAGKALGAIGSNVLHRYGHHIPGMKGLGQEIAGVGARTAMQGKPMLSSPLRHALNVTTNPELVGAYEKAHGLARKAMAEGMHPAELQQQLAQHAAKLKSYSPEAAQAAEFAKGVPLESKGLRKVVDYGFTPVSQVGQDIKNVAGRAASSVRGAAGRAASGVGSAIRKANPMKLLKKRPA